MKFLPMLLCAAALADEPMNPYLEWDAVQFWTPTNYTVYVGGAGREYTNSYPVGTNIFWNIPKMKPGVIHFYAVTASYEEWGESDYSDEVWYAAKWLPTPEISVVGSTASWTPVPTTVNYTFTARSLTHGTNFTRATGTNTWSTVPDTTIGSWLIQVKADSAHTESRWGVKRIINIGLAVPSGKFYVEQGSTLSSMAPSGTVTGPTNLWFPVGQSMGFFKLKPYFVSAASPKSAKLVKSTAVAFPPTTVGVVTEPYAPFVGPINLDPSKAPR